MLSVSTQKGQKQKTKPRALDNLFEYVCMVSYLYSTIFYIKKWHRMVPLQPRRGDGSCSALTSCEGGTITRLEELGSYLDLDTNQY